MRRSIIYSPSCDIAADDLGGYVRIDASLEGAIQGLLVNPYSFPLIESDHYKARYVPTIPLGDLPSLVWLFYIDNENNVIMFHVEEFQRY